MCENRSEQNCAEEPVCHSILLESEVEGFPHGELLKGAIAAALEAEGMAYDCEVNVLITGDEGIRAINLEQRGVDRATDVLSFPMFDLLPGIPLNGEGENDARIELDGTELLPLGDMVISYERAAAQAAEYGHSEERELCYLAVHSVLHLLGYDHMDGDDGPQKRQMRAREEAIMQAIGLPRDRNGKEGQL